MGTLGTALKRGGEHVVTPNPQALGHEFPDPSALIGAVDEHEVGHALTLPSCRPLMAHPALGHQAHVGTMEGAPVPTLAQRAGMRGNLTAYIPPPQAIALDYPGTRSSQSRAPVIMQTLKVGDVTITS